jgi:CRISPR-associated protein Csx14
MGTNGLTTVISTIRGQPQVVTFAVDTLRAAGEQIDEVLALHLADPTGRTERTLTQLAAAFGQKHYHGLHYRSYLLRGPRQAVDDIYDESDASAVWEAVHRLLADLKRDDRRLHVCISGGRRMLALLVMSAAMLHFGHHDTLWHMYSPEDLRAAADEGALVSLPPDSGFRLIRVPMMPWGSYFPTLRQLAQPDGELRDVLAGPRAWMDAGERERCRHVVAQLTPRQRELLYAFAQGLSPQEVAEKLVISIKTVDAHKTVILAVCRNAWALPAGGWLDYHFLREKFADVHSGNLLYR